MSANTDSNSLVAFPEEKLAVEEFKILGQRLQSVGRLENIDIIPYSGYEPVYFAKLPPAQQQRTLATFGLFVEVCESLQKSGGSVLSARQLVWHMLVRLKLKPPANLFEHFEDSDIIEIYDSSDWVQIFRNFAFFRVCSYTLDEILSRPWWELYKRAEEKTKHIMEVAVRAASDATQSIHPYQTGKHDQTEMNSRAMYYAKIEHRFVVSLLAQDGMPLGVLNVVRPYSVVAMAGSEAGVDVLPSLQRQITYHGPDRRRPDVPAKPERS